jgi:hypothetical protein
MLGELLMRCEQRSADAHSDLMHIEASWQEVGGAP